MKILSYNLVNTSMRLLLEYFLIILNISKNLISFYDTSISLQVLYQAKFNISLLKYLGNSSNSYHHHVFSFRFLSCQVKMELDHLNQTFVHIYFFTKRTINAKSGDYLIIFRFF